MRIIQNFDTDDIDILDHKEGVYGDLKAFNGIREPSLFDMSSKRT
jgi:hypothetical protein